MEVVLIVNIVVRLIWRSGAEDAFIVSNARAAFLVSQVEPDVLTVHIQG